MSTSPYITVYHVESGEPTQIYAASLASFIETGEYTTAAPGTPPVDPATIKAKLPTAGREAIREGLLEHHLATTAAGAPAPTLDPAAAPTKTPPKRRAPAADEVVKD